MTLSPRNFDNPYVSFPETVGRTSEGKGFPTSHLAALTKDGVAMAKRVKQIKCFIKTGINGLLDTPKMRHDGGESAKLPMIMMPKPVLLFLMGFGAVAFAAETEFKPRVVIKRSFPPIVEPRIASAKKADGSIVKDDELVLGVVVGDAARAYPINTLTGPRREIINDDLGGRAIAATW